MIFRKPCQIVTHTYIRRTPINIRTFQNSKVFFVEFVNVCEWFVDNKRSIHFGEDKTKCILFSKEKNCRRLT